MKVLATFITITVLNGCAVIAGQNYHAIDDVDTSYIDCFSYIMGIRGSGVLVNLNAPTNNKVVKHHDNDIVICAKSTSRESMYLFGIIVPLIPTFGVGNDQVPHNITFYVYNRSKNKVVRFSMNEKFEYCFKEEEAYSRCKKNIADIPSITIPSASVLELDVAYNEQISFDLELDDGEVINLNFTDERGLFFILGV